MGCRTSSCSAVYYENSGFVMAPSRPSRSTQFLKPRSAYLCCGRTVEDLLPTRFSKFVFLACTSNSRHVADPESQGAGLCIVGRPVVFFVASGFVQSKPGLLFREWCPRAGRCCA